MVQDMDEDIPGELNLEEITTSLCQLSLTCVKLGDYLMVIKSDLDLFIDDEPYLALMLILNTKSGLYKAKLWNKTLLVGRSFYAEELVQVCKKHFGQGKPCVGFQLELNEQAQYEDLLPLLPSPRKVAKDCHKFLKEGDSDDNLCSGCKKLSLSRSLDNVSMTINSNIPDSGSKDRVTSPKIEPIEDDYDETIQGRSEYSGIEDSKSQLEDAHTGDNPLLDEADLEDKPMFNEADLTPVTKQALDKQLHKECPWCKKTIARCGGIDAFQEHRAACLMLVLEKRAKSRGVTIELKSEIDHSEDGKSDNDSLASEEDKQRYNLETRRRYIIKQPIARATPTDQTCHECKKNFDTEERATVHKKFVHFWGIFSCPECTDQFDYADDLIQHIRQEAGHREDANVTCPSCREESSVTKLASHYKRCILREIQREKFGIYENTHFQKPQVKQAHEKVSHRVTTGQGRGYYPRISKSHDPWSGHGNSSSQIGERVICSQCGNSFKNKEILLRHNRIHLREQGAEKDETPGKEPLYYHCEHCGKVFVSKTGVIKHKQQQHEGVNERATCEKCGITFITRDRLWRHNNMHHSDDDTYKCKYCGKRCSTRPWLARHIASKHEEPKFKCSFCDRRFTFKKKLEGHENEHKGIKPYVCKICDASYAYVDGLRSHAKKKHNQGLGVIKSDLGSK